MPKAQQKGTEQKEINVYSGQMEREMKKERQMLAPMTPKLHITMNVLRPQPQPQPGRWTPGSLSM